MISLVLHNRVNITQTVTFLSINRKPTPDCYYFL